MERIELKRTHKRVNGTLFSLMALGTGMIVSACGSGATGGTMGGLGLNEIRRQLPSEASLV